MITFTLGGIPEKGIGPVVGTIRTSGTEPKIKFYLEANGTGERSVVDEHLAKVREALGEEWLKWSKWGFEKPKE
jgi:phosphoglucomutase